MGGEPCTIPLTRTIRILCVVMMCLVRDYVFSFVHTLNKKLSPKSNESYMVEKPSTNKWHQIIANSLTKNYVATINIGSNFHNMW